MEPQPTAKTVLITGAASGIGQELARLFAKDGYRLILVDKNQEGLDTLASHFQNQYGSSTTLIAKNLADPEAPQEIYDQTTGQGQVVDILVNDAGFGVYGLFATETDVEQEKEIVQVNAVALMHLTKLFLRDMIARNEGKILLLGSEVSVAPSPMQAVYGATKAFIKSFGESVRSELKGSDSKVTITVLMPGATNTNFFKTAGAAHVKGADPQKTANPADVAKEGYEALMAGKDHIVAGWMNKARVAMAHLLPDPLVAASARRDMMPKEEAEQQQRQTMIVLGVAAAVIGGIWLLTRNNSSALPTISAYDKARYKYKAGKGKWSAYKALTSATASVKGAYDTVKENLEDDLA